MIEDAIRRKEAIDAIANELDMIDHVPQWVSDRLVKALRGVPSIDAVQVVRCKDCKYARMTYDGDCKYCDVWFPDEAEYLDGDYYCASAERKEE